MTRDLMDATIARILVVEGAVAHHPLDRGGLTSHGLTKPWLLDVTGREWSDADVRALGPRQARGLITLWMQLKRLDCLPDDPLLAWVVTDFAFHAGHRRAVKALQKYLGVTADGIAGAETQGAWHQLTPAQCRQAAAAVVADRAIHHFNDLAANPEQVAFGRGWGQRLAEQIRACGG